MGKVVTLDVGSDGILVATMNLPGRPMNVVGDELMAGIAHAARTVAWIADETWDRVGASLSTTISLLGWRSRDRAPGLVVRDSQPLAGAPRRFFRLRATAAP